ncbi:MAG TPA: NAD(P)-binding domain-containing protein, partial [Candidatus Eisenbacteria bacterium]|nr:NAD(P)-binding domain-containing protein [Candidatus Eisenbacteria bacterium]
MPRTSETIVIGAGQAGLSTSYFLNARGREHIVLERGRIGETWRSERWDGFYLNTPNWCHRLPGFHYTGPKPDAFGALPEVIAYLEDYARSYRAPVREGVEVQAVRPDGSGFTVETNAGTLTAENVVVAAGAYQRPTPTPLMAAVPSGVMQIHTSQYRRPSQLPDGAVVMVGGGQSGCQIAEELIDAGRKVYLAAGRCPWLPRRYRGRDVMHWMLETGLADQTVDTLPSPAARLLCNVPVSGNGGGHDCNPRWLARRGAALLGRVEGVDGWRLRIGGGLEESLAIGDDFVAAYRKRVDDHVAAKRLSTPDPEPQDPRDPIASPGEVDLRQAGVST